MSLTDDNDSIELVRDGSDFTLTRTKPDGSKTQIALSEHNVISLAQSAQRLIGPLLQRLSREGLDAVVLTPVARIGLSRDVHNTTVHLTMFDHGGAQVAFSLPVEIVRPLVERLPVHLAALEKSKPTKQ